MNKCTINFATLNGQYTVCGLAGSYFGYTANNCYVIITDSNYASTTPPTSGFCWLGYVPQNVAKATNVNYCYFVFQSTYTTVTNGIKLVNSITSSPGVVPVANYCAFNNSTNTANVTLNNCISTYTYSAATNSSPFTSFTSYDASGNWSNLGNSSPTTPPYLTYFGFSPFSSSSYTAAIGVPAFIPAAPTITSITNGNGSLSVAFTAPGNYGGPAITNYQYSTDGGSTFTVRSPVSTGTPILISGLMGGTTYSVVLKAINSDGVVGIASNSASGTPTSTTPGAPTINSATPGNQSIKIAYSPPSNNGAVITSYQYSLNGGSYTTASDVSGNMFSITGLTNGTTYSVLLKAVNINGAGTASNSVSATPSTTPSAPTINSATSGNQSIKIAYSPPSNDGGAVITSYQYSLNGGSYTTALDVSANMFSITGLINGTTYSVLLKAVNINGAGSASNSTSATPSTTPSAPTINSTAPRQGIRVSRSVILHPPTMVELPLPATSILSMEGCLYRQAAIP